MPKPAGPLVSVCVCTRDRPAYLRACLAGLAAQTVPASQFEIIVVDSFSDASNAAAITLATAELGNARVIRLARAGLSAARNAGAEAARGVYVAYIDDDAIPAPDWIERIEDAAGAGDPPPALIGGRILPIWERPLPVWWPTRLTGVLTIIEHDGRGEYRTAALPGGLEPYGANLIVHRAAMQEIGGFDERIGRNARALLSDEDVQLAWRLQRGGHSARYDSRIVVRHAIQASRLTPGWLLRRLYWQGASGVVTRRLLGDAGAVRRGLARRLLVAVLLLPSACVPRRSTALLGCRWRLAYSLGYLRAALAGPRFP